ncbi:MAG: TRAP transporter substrate-binding protein DctP [Clostridia bacterium]|nr:TRAP transporter substrate-binding protein DctP [Clostridia bacterium]
MMWRKGIVLFLGLLFLWVSAGAVTLEMATVRETGHPAVEADQNLAGELARATGNAFEVSVGAAGSLYGDEKGILDALVRGDVALGHVSMRVLEEKVPALAAFSLPFLINSDEHLQAVLWGMPGQTLREIIETRIPEVKVLGWYNCGGRCFYTLRQVASPFDMPGLTLCAENTESMQNYLRALGAKPQWMARHSVYSALFQGVLDGGENDLVSLVYLGDYDAARYILLDRHTYAPEVLLVSRAVYDRMGEAEGEALCAAARAAEQMEWDHYAQKEKEAVQALRDFGCTLTFMDGGVREAFTEKATKAVPELGGRSVYDLVGTEQADLIDEIRQMGESYPPRDR